MTPPRVKSIEASISDLALDYYETHYRKLKAIALDADAYRTFLDELAVKGGMTGRPVFVTLMTAVGGVRVSECPSD